MAKRIRIATESTGRSPALTKNLNNIYVWTQEQQRQLKGYRNALEHYLPQMAKALEKIACYESPTIDCHLLIKSLTELEEQFDKINQSGHEKPVKGKQTSDEYDKRAKKETFEVEKNLNELYKQSASEVSRLVDTLHKALLRSLLEQEPWLKISKIIQRTQPLTTKQAELSSVIANWRSEIDQGGGDSPIKNQSLTILASIKEPSDLELVCFALDETDKAIEDRVKGQLEQTKIIESTKDEMSRLPSPSLEQIARLEKAVADIQKSQDQPNDYLLLFRNNLKTLKEYNKKNQETKAMISFLSKESKIGFEIPDLKELEIINQGSTLADLSGLDGKLVKLKIESMEIWKKENLDSLKELKKIASDEVEKSKKILEKINQIIKNFESNKNQKLKNSINQLTDRLLDTDKKIREAIEKDRASLEACVKLEEIKSFFPSNFRKEKDLYRPIAEKIKDYKRITDILEEPKNLLKMLQEPWKNSDLMLLEEPRLGLGHRIFELLIEDNTNRSDAILEQIVRILDLGHRVFEFLIEDNSCKSDSILEQIVDIVAKNENNTDLADKLNYFIAPLSRLSTNNNDLKKIIQYIKGRVDRKRAYSNLLDDRLLERITFDKLETLKGQVNKSTISYIKLYKGLLGLLDSTADYQDKSMKQLDAESYDEMLQLLMDPDKQTKFNFLLTHRNNKKLQLLTSQAKAINQYIGFIDQYLENFRKKQNNAYSTLFFKNSTKKQEAFHDLQRRLKTSPGILENPGKIEQVIEEWYQKYQWNINEPRFRFQFIISLYYLIVSYLKTEVKPPIPRSQELVEQLKRSPTCESVISKKNFLSHSVRYTKRSLT